MSHLERCVRMMDRYRDQGRAPASIKRMLIAVGACRYLTPFDLPEDGSWLGVWHLRSYLRDVYVSGVG